MAKRQASIISCCQCQSNSKAAREETDSEVDEDVGVDSGILNEDQTDHNLNESDFETQTEVNVRVNPEATNSSTIL